MGAHLDEALSVVAVRDGLRARGLRWTAQRRTLVEALAEVLARTGGHVTATELIERCRAVDPATTPSTVYRTLDALERLGVVRHSHDADGREEFHVLPAAEHGHLECSSCGRTWEIDAAEAALIGETIDRGRGFAIDLSHLTIVGRCEACRAALTAG